VTEVLAAGGDGIPSTVTDVIAGRLGGVSPPARRAAEAVAVIGSPAPLLLVSVLVDDAPAAVSELLGAGLLQPTGGGVEFRHELARMATLEAIPAYARAALHAQVLERLRADPSVSEDHALLAHHAEAAGDSRAVLTHAPQAAAQAEAFGAHREAAAHYHRALHCGASPPPEQRAALLEGLARTSLLTGRLTDAVAALEQAITVRDDLGDQLRMGDDLRFLSFVLQPAARYTEARRAGEPAIQVLERVGPSRELAWAYMNMCQLSTYTAEALPIIERYGHHASELADRFDEPGIRSQVRFHTALLRYVHADVDHMADEAWADVEAARAATLDANLVEAAAFMAMMMTLYAGTRRDDDRARSALDRLETHARDRELSLYLACGRGYRALSLLYRGRWDEAADLAASALDDPSTPPLARTVPTVVSGLIRARRGDLLSPLLSDSVATSVLASGTLLTSAARAEAAWLHGDHHRARVEAQRGLDVVTEHTIPWAAGELARWALLAGGEAPTVPAAAPFALELAGDWAGAASMWNEMGCAYDAGLARLSGDVPALIKALTAFETLGARPAAAIAKSRLRAQGASIGIRGPRADTRANPHGLTARQLEILSLLREGLTGPQIATRLHISPKTAENHVGAILAKLNVRSRAGAIAKLGQ
jgi:DNA-binding CsgD family transcriptional regulator/tetratricopeptide (TPR) repeat protein